MKELILQINDFLPLRDVVFNTLREAILCGKLSPGERLMEIKLAELLGVSRTPVREAIRKLELEGLVVMTPRKGAQVAKITKEDLVDVLEVRKVLESLAVELACELITSEDINNLRTNLEEFKVAIANGDLTQMAKKDESFHDIIYSITGNKRLVQILNNLREQMYRYRLEYIKEESKRHSLITEHIEFINALERRDKLAAKNAVSTHIYNQKQTILEAINIL